MTFNWNFGNIIKIIMSDITKVRIVKTKEEALKDLYQIVK